MGLCASTMTTAAIPRYLLPRLDLSSLRKTRLLSYAAPRCEFQYRNAASNSTSSKPRVLEKPTKFYPPSHPQRLAKRTVPRQYPGPPLSQAQKQEQKVKKYPHMMPGEGTFMFWFLNSRMLHMGICLVLIHPINDSALRFSAANVPSVRATLPLRLRLRRELSPVYTVHR